LLNARIAICASRCGYHVEDVRRCVYAHCDIQMFMARLMLDATELEDFWCSTMQICQKLSTKSSLFQCPL